MKRTRTSLLAVVLAVALGLFFAPSSLAGSEKTPDQTLNDHPSGKDRTDKPTEGKPQGRSQSDPDGMANGGADKPGMDGGFDADKDGNNGCGNDDDFEDDNNGWCGKHPKKAKAASVKSTAVDDVDKAKVDEAEASTVSLARQAGQAASEVLGVTFVRSVVGPTESAAALSATTAAAVGAPDALPRTGQYLGLLSAVALLLISIGTVAVAAEQRHRPALARVRTRR